MKKLKSVFLLWFVMFANLQAQDRFFLTYPFEESVEAVITTAWYYPNCSDHAPKGAIDYDQTKQSGNAEFMVLAAADGEVVKVKYSPSLKSGVDNYGNWIAVKHTLANGHIYYTMYAHMAAYPAYTVGDQVQRGQFLGFAWNSGSGGSMNVHLHFEIRGHENTNPDFPFVSTDYTNFPCIDPYDKKLRQVNDFNNPANDYAVDCPAEYDGDENLITYNPYPHPKNPSYGSMGSNHLWKTDAPYPTDIIGAGYYSDGWHIEAGNNYPSWAFEQKARENKFKIGRPFNHGGGADVHEWYGVYVQDWWQPNEEDSQGNPIVRFGTDGQSAIILSPDPTEAYLLKEGFWGWYKTSKNYGIVSNPDYKPQGPVELGRPTSDEDPNWYDPDRGRVVTRQTFEHGYLVYDDQVEDHIAYDSFGVRLALLVENYVTIESDPIGAQVWDGTIQLTTTPLVLYLNEGETKTLTAKMSGYYDKEFPVEWQDGQEVVVY